MRVFRDLERGYFEDLTQSLAQLDLTKGDSFKDKVGQ